MQHVDFYILGDADLARLQAYACSLASDSWQSGKRVLIQTDSSEQSQLVDSMLWDLHSTAFIPHGIATLEPIDQQQPVLIAHQKITDSEFQHVINLSSRPCDIVSGNNSSGELSPGDVNDTVAAIKIDEILNQDEQRKQCGRLNYKIYRDLGYTLKHHTVDTQDE